MEAELADIEQRIEVHVGGKLIMMIALMVVDEVAGGGTKIELVPNLDYETHFEDIEVSTSIRLCSSSGRNIRLG